MEINYVYMYIYLNTQQHPQTPAKLGFLPKTNPKTAPLGL